ncbi:YoaK family protein [Micrococcus luteus]|uniref:YoaK family protein n=1 Tax=Micrococcus luteus TaxID=1270 RepID=UPI00097EC5E7|nr:YoaK family protein [Micrococcus luteus]SJN36133.1 Probable transmembrane protein [Micrococcus luteus Mu201]
MLNLCAPERTVRRNTHLALVLTAIAGILNSVGFVAVATYTSHMTGIVASMADAAVLHAPGLVGTGLLALAMFILGAVVCALVFNWGRVNGLRSRYANILLLEGVGMLVFGLLAEHVRDAHRPLVVVAALCFTVGLLALLVALFFLGGVAGAAGHLWLGFEVVIPVAGVLLLIAHRPLIQDLQDAWLTRRPRRR